jgi:Yip1 domain
MGMDPNQTPGGQGYPPPPGGQGYPPPPGGQGYYPPPPGYPPQGGYGGPGMGGGYGAPAPAPAGINGLFQKWTNVTTRPGAASFANELPTANWSDVWISIIGLGVLTSITGFIGRLLYRSAFSLAGVSGLTADQQRLFSRMANQPPAGAFANIIGVPLGFFIGVGILFLVAKMFGGTGTFLRQAYAFALFVVPIDGVSAVVGLVPVLGWLVSFALFIYGIVLAVFAISASQRLDTGKSVAVLLIPLFVGIFLACVLLIVGISILLAVTGGR